VLAREQRVMVVVSAVSRSSLIAVSVPWLLSLNQLVIREPSTVCGRDFSPPR
jgi:hypothetical protein